jgi:hypothetical protein
VRLPGAAEWEGETIAEQLRLGVESVGARTAVGVTASFGVSCGIGPEIEFAEMYRRADRALYQAKRGSRDRVSTGRSPVSVSDHWSVDPVLAWSTDQSPAGYPAATRSSRSQSTSRKLCIGQYFGPHIEQNSAVLK